MKISKLFHWLYACIMFLPLLVIPIFAINIINRSPTPISIQYQVDDVKNFYQGVKNGKPTQDLNYWVAHENAFIEYRNDKAEIGFELTDDYLEIYTDTLQLTNDEEVNKFYLTFYASQDDLNTKFTIYLEGDNAELLIIEDYIFNNDYIKYSFVFDARDISSIINPYFDITSSTLVSETYLDLGNLQLFNLTQIFGSGNEPTKEVFESYLTQDYYDFGDNDVVVGKTYITYDDTDIGSQYVYSLYHVVDKYFNFNNILPFEGVYNWFLANVFSGVSPVGFTLLYNLMMYWLFVSLIWLMFDVFMYLPLVIHNLIDKARIE